jgi:glucose/arabinose dehydrogenase
MKLRPLTVILAILLGAAILWLVRGLGVASGRTEFRSVERPVPGRADTYDSLEARFRIVTVAEGLENPWALAFLPSGRMLVTERPGRIRLIEPDGTLHAPLDGVPQVVARGQGGMLDLVLAPDFAESGLVYVSYAGGAGMNEPNSLEVARFTLDEEGNRVLGLERIFKVEPEVSSGHHFGGRMVFAPDGHLFVVTGERNQRNRAQDTADGNGSSFRLDPDGTIPGDNPFQGRAAARPEIWSYGHRNPQGLAVQPETGLIWETEHGPRGGDEVNILKPGLNYGWPVATFGREYSGGYITEGLKDGIEPPLHYWVPSIAPSGLAFYQGDAFPGWKGDLFVGGLVGQVLVRLDVEGDAVVGVEERLLTHLHERIRDVRSGPDGCLYLLTDNAQGRILRLEPAPTP